MKCPQASNISVIFPSDSAIFCLQSFGTVVLPRLLYDFPNAAVVFTAVLIIQTTCLRIGRRGGIGIAQKGLNTGKYGRYIVNRGPLVLQNVQTNLPVIVDVGV